MPAGCGQLELINLARERNKCQVSPNASVGLKTDPFSWRDAIRVDSRTNQPRQGRNSLAQAGRPGIACVPAVEPRRGDTKLPKHKFGIVFHVVLPKHGSKLLLEAQFPMVGWLVLNVSQDGAHV